MASNIAYMNLRLSMNADTTVSTCINQSNIGTMELVVEVMLYNYCLMCFEVIQCEFD